MRTATAVGAGELEEEEAKGEGGEEEGRGFSSSNAVLLGVTSASFPLAAAGTCFSPMASLRSAALEASRDAGGGMRGCCF